MNPELIQQLKNRSLKERTKNENFLQKLKRISGDIGDIFNTSKRIYGVLDNATSYYNYDNLI